jgi:FkbM family methyltransferase
MINRKSIKKWLFGKCPGLAGRFPYFGASVYFPKDSEMFGRACEEGVFEAVNLSVISSVWRQDTFYIDVGANIGLMSVPLLDRFDTCKVLSFEPSPTTLPFLRRTHALSPHKARWHICEKAAGFEEGEVSFYTADGGRDAFEGMRDTNRGGDKRAVLVPMTTIDRQLAKLDNPLVSVIKIDVEGAELDVLRGAVECLRRSRPFVIMEWNYSNIKAYGTSPEDLLTLAQNLDYEAFSVPKLLHAGSGTALKLYMTFTETFLLVPNNTDVSLVKAFEFMQ